MQPEPRAAVSSRSYLPCLTGLRGVAASWVVLLHLWLLAGAPQVAALGLPLTPLFFGGALGVDLFFVLSGFLVGRPFMAWALGQRPWPNLLVFIKRRCLRVLPAFYFQLLVLLVLGWWIAGEPPIGAGQFAAYLSMEFLWYPHIGPLLNDVWWSLPVEWNFYLLLPLLAIGFARLRPWLMVVLVLAWVLGFRIALYSSLFDPGTGWFGYGLIVRMPARIDQFMIGMLAARLYLLEPGPSRLRTLGLVSGLLGMLAYLYFLYTRGNILDNADAPLIFVHFSIVGVLLGLIVLGSAAGGRLARLLFGGRVLAFLGLISYSMYLWHSVLFSWAAQHGLGQWSSLLDVPVVAALLAATVIVAWLSYRFVERPFFATAPATVLAAPEASPPGQGATQAPQGE